MNYIGSKLSLLYFLEESINKVIKKDTCQVFCDLFSGTGAVGSFFKTKGYSIIANDLQYYSYVLNKQYIGNHRELSFDGLKDTILKLNSQTLEEKKHTICNYLSSIPLVKGFIYKNYSYGGTHNSEYQRMYFSDKNAQKCDAIRIKIEDWKLEKKITLGEYYFLLTSLLESIDKYSNTASVYGAFLKEIKKTAQKSLILKPAKLILNNQEHKVYNEDANNLIKNEKMDILYLDPPYNQRQYASNYHILETIAKYDNPAIKGKTGLRDYKSQKSNYCSKHYALSSFKELISNANSKYIFLSYNNEGIMNFEEIQNIMSSRGTYGYFSIKNNRYKADKKRNYLSNSTIEYLHYVKCN